MSEFPPIPGYKITRELGAGGMATVYLGIQERLNRQVAIKVLSPVLLVDKQFTERFLKEAETAAGLNHSNIISIFDIGHEGNHNYLVMEYLKSSLKDRITAGRNLNSDLRIVPEEALRIVKDIARALDYAHAKGFIHRDIKPDNIMFREDQSPVLVDFGIARAIGSATKLTKTGMSIGTPHYMSPEQSRGKELDARSDIYSLGVVFYEMLTRQVPYDAEDSVAIAIKHIQEPVPILQVRQVGRDKNKQIIREEELGKYQLVLNRMMAKLPQDRPGSGRDLIALIEKVLSAPVPAVSTGPALTPKVEQGHPVSDQVPPPDVQDPSPRYAPDSPGVKQSSKLSTVKALVITLIVLVGVLLIALLISSQDGPELGAKYDRHIRDARSWLRQGRFDRALASAQQAKNIKHTNEVDNLIGQIPRKGALTFPSSKYEGYILNGKPHYHGTRKYNSGRKYIGGWNYGREHGQGTLYYPSGKIVYTGKWENGKISGYGTLNFENGNRYEGNFKDGKRNGKGGIYYTNGNYYIGEWRDDKKHGQGIFGWKQGETRYEGKWYQDRAAGGWVYFSNGNRKWMYQDRNNKWQTDPGKKKP